MSNVARDRSPSVAPWPDVVSLSPAELGDALVARLAGGSGRDGAERVDWALGEARVGVRVADLDVSLRPGSLTVELPLVPASGGRAVSVTTTWPVGRSGDDATLTSHPEARPLGDARVAGRWSAVVAEVLWAALLEIGAGLVDDRSTADAPLVLGGVFVDGATLSFAAAARFRELDAIPAAPVRRA